MCVFVYNVCALSLRSLQKHRSFKVCAMDFLTNDINIYITCPHSSFFLSFFLNFRETFYDIASCVLNSVVRSLPFSLGFLPFTFCHSFSRTSLIQAFFLSKLLSVLELLDFVVAVAVVVPLAHKCAGEI